MKLDISSALKSVQGFIKDLENVTKEALMIYQRDVKSNIQRDNSFKGTRLRNRIRYTYPTRYSARSYTGVAYARFLEEGTKPHIIRAKKKALKFVARSGETVFRKQVNHPGTKRTSFWSRAHNNAFSVLERRLTYRLAQIARRHFS